MEKEVKIHAKGWLVELPSNIFLSKSEPLNHSFFLPGLDKATQITEVDSGNDFRVLVFNFFNGSQAVSYAFVRGNESMRWKTARGLLFNNKGIKAPANEHETLARFMGCSGLEEDCTAAASKFIRRSETLKHNKSVKLDRGGVYLMVEPRGFACYTEKSSELNLVFSRKNNFNSFERWVVLFALKMAYRTVILQSIEKMGDVLKRVDKQCSNSKRVYTELSNLRESVAMFDARYYFQSPVKPDRHELFTLSKYFLEVFDIKSLHSEMKSQISDVSNVVSYKLEDVQQRHHEVMEKKAKRLNLLIGAVAGVFAVVEFLSHVPSEWRQAYVSWAAFCGNLL